MSKKRSQTYCLAIDASIAQAAGSLESVDPIGICCRDSLVAVRSVCHRLAWSKAIQVEWVEHQSPFAAGWLTSMMDLKKLRPVQDEPSEELRKAIEGHSEDENVVAIMLKDAHLVEAALATDSRIVSLDETPCGHFSRLAARFAPLRTILWVNPVAEGKRAVEWLETGAKAERSRRLKR